MIRRSDAKLVVERMTVRDLREFLEHHELATSGHKPELVARLLRQHRGDLAELMRDGPWLLEVWKSFAERHCGDGRARSYDDLAEYLAASMSYGGAQEYLRDRVEDGDDDDDDDRAWRREFAGCVTPCPCRSGKTFEDCHGKSNGRPPESSEPRGRCVGSSSGSGRPDLHESEAWVLDVARLAWPPRSEQVRAARRELAMLFHPDKHGGHPAAAEKMKFLNEGCDRLEARIAD